ncbi:hypothetical protein ER57_10840 [Smithella sp. SCADC]|nr:hypothetical protein ER57_10840 [Smithella sp. SCADC]HAR48595.1 hypothetical protein [Smithella sp.]
MTAAKAGRVRTERIEGRCKSRKEVREQVKAAKLAEAGKWTLQKLWEEYEANKGDSKSINTDKGRFEKYIAPAFGNKEPQDIIRLDADRLRVSLSKKLKPQTVKHIFGLLKRIVHFGAARQLCQSLNFEIEPVKVDNQKTEDLNPEQLKKLLEAIDKSTDIEAANIMRLASSGKVDLYTLQKLLTHKSPVMTQRYAHLRDEALRNASTLAGQIIEQAVSDKEQDSTTANAS